MTRTAPAPLDDAGGALALLQRRFDRERAARKAAETLLTAKARELFDALTTARQSEQRLQLALWASGEGIWEWIADDDALGIERFEIAGREVPWPAQPLANLVALVHEPDRESMMLAWQLHLAGSRPDFDRAVRLLHDGEHRWVRIRGRALERDERGRATRVSGTLKDITTQRHAEGSLHLMAHAFSSTRDALAVADARWRIVEANNAFCAMFRAPIESLRAGSLLDHVDLGDLALDPQFGQGVWRGERTAAASAGRVPLEVSVTAVLGHDDGGTCYIVALRDISERKHAEARLKLRDTLTGLPNRAALEARLESLCAGDDSERFGLLFMDLDGFKEVNDSFGHEMGDELLRQVAARLVALLPDPAFVGRWGGDEFVIVLPPGSGEQQVRSAAGAVIARFGQALQLGGHDLSVGASNGAVLAPRDGTQAATLLARADAAMYAAKDAGRNGWVFFDPALEEAAHRRVRLLGLLRTDARRNAFRFAAQPKVDRQRRVSGAEVLMRWSTDAFGAVSPAEFIPLAEQVGLIHVLGRHAMHAAARLVVQTSALGRPLKIAVNLSPKQLQHRRIEQQLLEVCERHGVAPQRIELEVTESALIDGMDAMTPLFARLRAAGFSLALDDFGTGYSSLSYLRQLPFDKVKIDRSFVQDIAGDARAARMLDSIVGLCHGLGMSTVAEGVETVEQFEALHAMGVQEFQGYLFAKPMPVEEWVVRLRDSGG